MTVADLLALFEAGGDATYGEDVTLASHSLQSAALARADGAADELVASALLHDVGHLLGDVPGGPGDGADDRHEAVGGRLLGQVFGPAVARPVSLHVTAKRWRCAVDPGYLEALSPTSVASLALQGGPLDAAGCRRFEAHPGFEAAIELRRWDDLAKVVDADVAPLSAYVALLDRLSRVGRTQRGGRSHDERAATATTPTGGSSAPPRGSGSTGTTSRGGPSTCPTSRSAPCSVSSCRPSGAGGASGAAATCGTGPTSTRAERRSRSASSSTSGRRIQPFVTPDDPDRFERTLRRHCQLDAA